MATVREKQLQDFRQLKITEHLPEPDVEPLMIEPAKPKKNEPTAYYDSDQGKYWMRNDRAQWINVSETSIKRHLRLEVYSKLSKAEGLDNTMDRHLLHLQRSLDVEYAGPLAGYHAGIHRICGNRVLVTKSPQVIKGVRGTWDNLSFFIAQLLGEQDEIFHSWVKAARRSMHLGAPFRPGQMLCLAGPPGCGKSVLQGLITLMLGGRAAHPFRYMIGDTKFNSDLFYAEHLMIEDEAASTAIQARRDFGSKMKGMLVNQTQSYHRKTKEALPLTPFWRITVSLNDEAENLMVLPPLDESIKDKVILFKCKHAEFPGNEAPDDAFGKWLAVVQAELPGYFHWLNSFRVPPKLANKRFGVIAFQQNELLEALEELAPEVRLMNFIDTFQPWEAGEKVWYGTASDLEAKLISKDGSGRVAKLLAFTTACGVYLARLRHRYPERVEQAAKEGNRIRWAIRKVEEEPIPL